MTTQYEGGYFMIPEPLVRGQGAHAHTAHDLSQLSQYTVEAVNHIQDTPWMVNPFMLTVVEGFVALQQDLYEPLTDPKDPDNDPILRVTVPTDPRKDPTDPINHRYSPEEWGSMDRIAKQEFKKRRARRLTAYDKAKGVYLATHRIVTMAREMSDHEKFYFPHNMDFRTRIYPIPTDLNPQSSDLSKGLIRFKRPTRLGKDGYYWLGVMVASTWGEDKLSPDDRYEYAMDAEFMADLACWVDDPVNHLGWLSADKPFQFLAVAYEWVWANRQTNPQSFMSYLPGNLDGSCNGAQHLSIMAKDLRGATATNCRAGLDRNDLYQEVADACWEMIQRDLKQGNELAREWSVKMSDPSKRRKVVKRAVMTTPYGVTDRGVAEFMIKDNHVSESAENQWDSAKYMRDMIIASIGEVLDKGRQLQVWFSQCAERCAEAGVPMVWDTPAGSKVQMAYRNVIQKRIQAFGTRFYVYEEPDADEDPDSFYHRIGMQVSKMITAAPPNVVHACDASHLQITVCRMAEAGIRDFCMIHDSFGCPMAHVGLMRDILRQSVVDMYSDDYLIKFKESVERYTGVKMPPIPETGDFDITEILESEFFFA